jgi:thymidine phosphorylase
MVVAQGGDPEAPLLGLGTVSLAVRADRTGVVQQVDARGVGRAAFVLGAGRRRAEDPVDPGVGVVLERKVGAEVRPGDLLATLHHRDGGALDEALALLRAAIVIGDGPAAAGPLVRGTV